MGPRDIEIRDSQHPGTLLDLLNARRGIVCMTGAGGKKSALYRLAEMHPGRVAISATVHIPPFPHALSGTAVVADSDHLVERVTAEGQARVVAFALPSDKTKRYAGVPPQLLERIHQSGQFAVMYVKADGARFRWIKAPAEREPQVVPAASTVIPVVSARAIGQPLGGRVAHHPERLGEIVDLAMGQNISPEHVGRLLAHENGALRGCPSQAVVVPLINMVDDEDRRILAREAAHIALASTSRFDRVVLACLKRGAPLVEVVTR